jgi:N-acetylglucosamine kinase-like BadF-type ATPase
MILLAESGSTKTDWALIGDSEVMRMQTIGLNPYYLSENEIARAFAQVLGKFVSYTIRELHFYGAGCATEPLKEKIENIAKKAFPVTKVQVETDMLAACYGLLKKNRGIAGILGTGSNACFYDGKVMKETIPSNGIWLGDEGSGGYFGKILISNYLSNRLPIQLHKHFEATFDDRRNQIVEKVYQQKRPNAYLASFTPFLYQYKNESYIQEILQDGFTEFFNSIFSSFTIAFEHEIHLTGSVAFHFSKTIRAVAKGMGLKIMSTEQSPINGLIEYHQKKIVEVV